MNILSIAEIAALLRAQADMRSMENDEAGVLARLADELERDVADLDGPIDTNSAAWARQVMRQRRLGNKGDN